MSDRAQRIQQRLETSGAAAPPLENGEIVFEAPWQARLFGMAHSLCDAGCYPWSAFQDALIAAIARWEAAAAPDAEYPYWVCFQQALETLLAERGITGTEQLARRSAELAARPHDHDHQH